MMDPSMSADTNLSPLRRVLCSQSNAYRVATRMQADGQAVCVVATGDPLQPWRTMETSEAVDQESGVCA
jgi:precorrin-6B methylase 1